MSCLFRRRGAKIAVFFILFLVAVALYPLSQWIRETGDAVWESTFAPIASPLTLEVSYQGGRTAITPYEADDGNVYFFLPSIADPKSTSIVLNERDLTASLDGTEVRSGKTLSDLQIDPSTESDKVHKLVVGDHDAQDLIFMQSCNLPALFLRSKSGTLDTVEEEKEIHEGLLADAVDTDGTAIVGMKPEYIKGHGNTSYQRDKKPYQIKFTNSVSFFGMGAKEKWILLANRLDPSYLRNYATYELAKTIGLNAPEAKYIDLYINGEYRGNYLLTQKPEDVAAEALLEHNYGSRMMRREYYFITDRNEGFVIRWPDIIPDNRMEYLRSIVQQSEDEIVSGAEPLHFDYEGFAKKYLIEEFVLNEAQSSTSAWYYINNRKMYVTAVWDYDKSYGSHTRFQDPTAITRQSCYLERGRAEWFRYLTLQKDFNDLVWQNYREKLLPALVRLVQEQIPAWGKLIEGSVRMDIVRWPVNETCKYDYPAEVAELIGTSEENQIYAKALTQLTDWIIKRTLFYNDNEKLIRESLLLRFLDGEENIKKRDTVLPGTTYTDLPDIKDDDDNHVKAWKDMETKKIYRMGSGIKVTHDMMLEPIFEE